MYTKELPANIVLIDVPSFNTTITQFKRFFEKQLGRTLPNFQLEQWLTYLMADAGYAFNEELAIQILLVHDHSTTQIASCTSPTIPQLDGSGCHSPFGEFCFAAISAEELTSRTDFFLETLQITLDSSTLVHCMVVLSDTAIDDLVDDCLTAYLKQASEQVQITRFYGQQPTQPTPFKSDTFLYALMRAFGIKSEELE